MKNKWTLLIAALLLLLCILVKEAGLKGTKNKNVGRSVRLSSISPPTR